IMKPPSPHRSEDRTSMNLALASALVEPEHLRTHRRSGPAVEDTTEPETLEWSGVILAAGMQSGEAVLRCRGCSQQGRWKHEPSFLSGQVVPARGQDRKSTRLNSSHVSISYAVFCL